MRSGNKAVFAALAATFGTGMTLAQGPAAMVEDRPVLLGEPYSVAGVTYRPADPASYDELGYAEPIDAGSRGATTAYGETFVASAITAAHKSLPLPSYVEVTALDSGRTILVRINDRGPMRNDRIIGLSPGAMAQLGLAGGPAPVRVRRVNPPDQDQVALRRHERAAERLESPPALLKVLRERMPRKAASPATTPTVASTPTPAPLVRAGASFDTPAKPTAPRGKTPTPPATPAMTKGGYVVQVGAFSSRANADALAKRIGAQVHGGQGLWRVRFGPYPTRQAAQAGVRAAAAQGLANMPIMANDER
ncbi:MAG: SPOR domain-containing protein [Pseudomonadota bacterium]|uniref:SPOR domain-containing protein n=1 Tax=Sphingobium naphthae TaxID=1886786 RepID=UPI002B1A3765|nr:SPOR domain-containing protein [Pseudomonadota bacterium]